MEERLRAAAASGMLNARYDQGLKERLIEPSVAWVMEMHAVLEKINGFISFEKN